MRDSFIFLLFCSNLREKNGHNQGQKICDPIKDLKNILIFYQPNSKTSYVGTPTFTSAMKKYVGEGICCHASHQYGRYHTRGEYEESILCRLQSMQARKFILDLKPRADIEYRHPKKRTNVLQKLILKKNQPKLHNPNFQHFSEF